MIQNSEQISRILGSKDFIENFQKYKIQVFGILALIMPTVQGVIGIANTTPKFSPVIEIISEFYLLIDLILEIIERTTHINMLVWGKISPQKLRSEMFPLLSSLVRLSVFLSEWGIKMSDEIFTGCKKMIGPNSQLICNISKLNDLIQNITVKKAQKDLIEIIAKIRLQLKLLWDELMNCIMTYNTIRRYA